MSMKCPKCGYENKPSQFASEDECPQCGVLYKKYEAYLQKNQQAVVSSHNQADNKIVPTEKAAWLRSESPKLDVDELGFSDLAGIVLGAVMSLWNAPYHFWNDIAQHLRIEGQQLTFTDKKLFFRGLATGLIPIVGIVIAASIWALVFGWNHRRASTVALLALLPVFCIPSYLVIIKSLWGSTLRADGVSVGPSHDLTDPGTIRKLSGGWPHLYLGGLSQAALMALWPWALGWIMVMHQWANRFEFNGYRYRVNFPPATFIFKYLIISCFTFGIGGFAAVSAYINQVLPSGHWERITVK